MRHYVASLQRCTVQAVMVTHVHVLRVLRDKVADMIDSQPAAVCTTLAGNATCSSCYTDRRTHKAPLWTTASPIRVQALLTIHQVELQCKPLQEIASHTLQYFAAEKVNSLPGISSVVITYATLKRHDKS
jgi:hypothetical protein